MARNQTSITINNEERDRLKKLFPNLSPAIALRAVLDLISDGNGFSELVSDVFEIRLRTIESEKRLVIIKEKEADVIDQMHEESAAFHESFEPETPEEFEARMENETNQDVIAKGVTSMPDWMKR